MPHIQVPDRATMRVIVIDNFDSFTFNLVQGLEAMGSDVLVVRNDGASAAEIVLAEPERILISPGPGGPEAAGVSQDVIRLACGRIPLLGVCLGHQCLATVFGGRVRNSEPVHGKTDWVHHFGRGLFAGLPAPFAAARYHSLSVERAALPPSLEVTAWTDRGQVMGLRHRSLPLAGVQFHPESFMTAAGPRLLRNFLSPAFARGLTRTIPTWDAPPGPAIRPRRGA